MKAIIVIDIKKDVDIKTLRADFEVYGDILINPYYQFRKGVELKPMPEKKAPLFDPNHCDIEEELKIIHEIVGYNRCVDEIIGAVE